MAFELELRGIPYCPKTELSVFYKNRPLQKKYIPDLLVFSEIVTELKAVNEIIPGHESQLLNYMRISRKPVGYLINFGPSNGVQWKRFILKEFIPERGEPNRENRQ